MTMLKIQRSKVFFTKRCYQEFKCHYNEKDFYNQPIDSDIKGYEETKNLITGQGEGYTTECFLDCEHTKIIIYIAAGLSRQGESEFDTKVTQQIDFLG